MKSKLNKAIVFGSVAAALSPFMVFAQTVSGTSSCASLGTSTTIETIICRIAVLINTIIPILIALGVVYFIWGVVQFVLAKDEEAKGRGRSLMINGLIGLLVIVSIWGLVNILRNSFGIYGTAAINVPCIQSPGVVCP
jgi:hypothetical protein